MSTLKTHNLQSADSGSVNIALAPNAGMVVTGISTFSANVNISGVSNFQSSVYVSDSIHRLGDADTKIRFPAADTFSVETAGSERLRITSTGALGTNSTVRSAYGGLDLCSQGATNYGTLTLGAGGGQNGQSRSNNQENQFRIMSPTYANPSNMFTVMYGASGSSMHEINYGGGTGWAYAANQHRFFTATDKTTATGTERLRIKSDGEILLGTGGVDRPIAGQRFNSASGWGGTLQIEKPNPSNGNNNIPMVAITAFNGANEQYTGGISFNRSNSNTQGTQGAVNTNQQLGNIAFNGSDGTNFIQGAEIFAIPDQTFATNDGPASLVFATTPDGTSETRPQERLRIDSGGRIFTGGDTQILNTEPGSLHISGGGTSGSRVSIRGTATGAGNGLAEVFAFWDTNKVAGMIAFAGEDTTNKDDGKLNFYTADGGGVQARLKISKEGYVTKPSNPKFWAKSTNAQTLNSNTTNYIKNYQNEVYDIGSCYDGTNKFTAPITGYYHFGWSFMLQGSNANTFTYLFGAPLISGNDIAQEVMAPRSGGAQYQSVVGSHLLYLTSGQYVQIRMRQSGGSNVSIRADQAYFWGYLVG